MYELHVKGFTKLHPHVPERLRGTYAALAEPAVIDHLTRLGVTAVELLPSISSFTTVRWSPGAAQLPGLSVDRLLRAPQRVLVEW
jgi:pullulanase/glycogen debranching enzyme